MTHGNDRRAAKRARVDNPGRAYHPWFPVLEIGSEKAALYSQAVVNDLAHAGRHLADPGWLLRVGLYLEFLTFMGICETVRDDVGDLLTPDEREAYDNGEQFREIRARIDPDAWREVWDTRDITFPRLGTPRTGPVSALNLLTKKRATLKFLLAHHADLQHAIVMAGPNHRKSQETWQRVFRDAERAVLRKAPDAFPELDFLPEAAREFVLWHRRGQFEIGLTVRVPTGIAALLSDQDGVFASACNEYRTSMNHVADWAKAADLMDHTGAECIPAKVSLLEAYLDDPERFAVLQRRDGFDHGFGLGEVPPAPEPHTAAEVADLLGEVPILALLDVDDLDTLGRNAKPIILGPTERLILQGQEGTSLFVIADGSVEVVLRREDDTELALDIMGPGQVFGEMALLTGERRNATVRAVDGALLYEIGESQYRPLLQAHPEWVDDLAAMMESRLDTRRQTVASHDASQERVQLSQSIRRRFFGVF